MKHAVKPGFVLTELLVTGLLTTFLMLGLIQMATGVSRGLMLIEGQSETQQGGRFAIDQVRNIAMAAGFHPSPWEPGARYSGLGAETTDGGSGQSDALFVRTRSDRNCYGNPNSTMDEYGQPAFFVRESKFEVTSSRSFAHTCWYGPGEGSMVRQINREGLVREVESFQLMFAEDTTGDRLADSMVRAQHWNNPDDIVGIRLGLLIATDKPLGNVSSVPLTVLDETISPPGDGRLRKVWTANIPLVSRLR